MEDRLFVILPTLTSSSSPIFAVDYFNNLFYAKSGASSSANRLTEMVIRLPFIV